MNKLEIGSIMLQTQPENGFYDIKEQNVTILGGYFSDI